MHAGFNPVGEVFFALCKTIDSPVSLGAWIRYREGSHTDLSTMGVNPRDYNDAASFDDDYTCVSFLSKWEGLCTGINLREAALSSFTSSEAQCKETNRRFRKLDRSPFDRRFEPFLFTAQRKIAQLLGSFDVSKLTNRYGWGPGAVYELPRRQAFLDTKMCDLPITVTPSAAAWLRREMESDLQWSASILGEYPAGPFCFTKEVFKMQRACRIDTVPKSAKTDRTIAIEPRGNGFLQKSIGDYIRDRLRMHGQDLNDQSRNQEYARRAYAENLATLDLKAASDTVSVELVYQLLPLDWASAMDSLRSRYAEMPDGAEIRLEKFSSMGNGFTFELESLIFWALAESVNDLLEVRDVVSVYGDDIIVHRSIASDLVDLLQFCGFTVNETKSFVAGNFFESCGKHYFKGIEVTPAYQKEVISTNGLSIVRLGNRIVRLALRRYCNMGFDPKLLPAWQAARRYAGRTSQFFIPFGITHDELDGDDGWLLPMTEWPGWVKTRHGSQLRIRVARPLVATVLANEDALFAWSLRRGVVTDSPYDDRSDHRSKLSYACLEKATDVESYRKLVKTVERYESVDRWVSYLPGWWSAKFE